MSWPQNFLAFFQNDILIKAMWEHQLQFYYDEIPLGDSTLVTCFVGDIGGNRLGLSSVKVFKMNIKQPVKDDRYFIWATYEAVKTEKGWDSHSSNADYQHERNNYIFTPIELKILSDEQCSEVIKAIKDTKDSWAWENATKEAKAALRVGYSVHDEARELVRKGAQCWQDEKDADKARSLIMKGLELFPEIDSARFDLGRLALDVGDINEAIKWLREELVSAKNPRELTTHMILAAIFEALDDQALSQQHKRAATEIETKTRAPRTSLSQELKEKIQSAARKTKVSIRTDETIRTPKIKEEKSWWRFWK